MTQARGKEIGCSGIGNRVKYNLILVKSQVEIRIFFLTNLFFYYIINIINTIIKNMKIYLITMKNMVGYNCLFINPCILPRVTSNILYNKRLFCEHLVDNFVDKFVNFDGMSIL